VKGGTPVKCQSSFPLIVSSWYHETSRRFPTRDHAAFNGTVGLRVDVGEWVLVRNAGVGYAGSVYFFTVFLSILFKVLIWWYLAGSNCVNPVVDFVANFSG
jgi:hypothetical protein